MICDIEMPGGSGLELLDQIRQAHYETVCIFLTAYAKFEYISRAMKLSSSDYLLKPLDDHALLEALDKACAQCEKQQKDRVNTLHANYWKESELPLAEQFFLDLLNGSISSAPSEVMDEIRYRRLIGSLLHNAPEWKRKRYVHRRRLPEALAGQERPRNRTAALEPFRR